jgi:hypothetical protein
VNAQARVWKKVGGGVSVQEFQELLLKGGEGVYISGLPKRAVGALPSVPPVGPVPHRLDR